MDAIREWIRKHIGWIAPVIITISGVITAASNIQNNLERALAIGAITLWLLLGLAVIYVWRAMKDDPEPPEDPMAKPGRVRRCSDPFRYSLLAILVGVTMVVVLAVITWAPAQEYVQTVWHGTTTPYQTPTGLAGAEIGHGDAYVYGSTRIAEGDTEVFRLYIMNGSPLVAESTPGLYPTSTPIPTVAPSYFGAAAQLMGGSVAADASDLIAQSPNIPIFEYMGAELRDLSGNFRITEVSPATEGGIQHIFAQQANNWTWQVTPLNKSDEVQQLRLAIFVPDQGPTGETRGQEITSIIIPVTVVEMAQAFETDLTRLLQRIVVIIGLIALIPMLLQYLVSIRADKNGDK